MRRISKSPPFVAASVLAVQLTFLAIPLMADEPRDEAMQQQRDSTSDAAQQQTIASGEPSDEEIMAAVDDELYFDPLVSRADIDVGVHDGTVTLTGATPTLLTRERAGHIAETVRGVRDVSNRIEVQPAKSPDADELRQQVESALRADPAAEAYQVHVRASDNGGITLTGAVDSWAEQKLAGRVASGVSGVTSVSNDVTIEPNTVRSESEIRSDVENKLRWDRYVDEGLIDVSVSGGIVSLSGHVGSAAERTRAMNLAWTAGVRSVDASALDVAPWADGRTSNQMGPRRATDAGIASAIERAFEASSRLAESDVEVAVDSGVVTLRGAVDNLKSKRAATSLAFATVGVLDVRDRLRVHIGADAPSDSAVRNEVENALARNSVTEASEVEVAVHGGDVRLRGDVDSALERMTAEDVAAGIDGVRRVDNDLRIDRDGYAFALDPYVDGWEVYEFYGRAHVPNPHGSSVGWRSDAAIEDDIRNQLRWSPFVDADQVTVNVDRGIATLKGTVDSYPERAAATENAVEGGAAAVVNNLQVRG
jgi:osmotically-inducible protein OsmY